MIDLLPSRVVRAFGSENAYSDALSSVNKFNARLLRERRIRLRLPFVDSQTHIIQTPTQNHLWKHPTQRLMPARHDQVASYARKQWHKKRPHAASNATAPPLSAANTNGASEQQSILSSNANGVLQTSVDDDPRLLVRAGDLGRALHGFLKRATGFSLVAVGMSDTDLQTITTMENPAMAGGRFVGGSSDDSSQSSAPPMTGLVQPQQPHWPQHNTAQNHHHLHSGNYILDADDDLDEFDYDDYVGGNGPATPATPASPVSAPMGRSKRGSSTKRGSQTSTRKSGGKTRVNLSAIFNPISLSLASSNPSGSSSATSSSTPTHTGNRRQQYTLAELPFVCEFCPARYKTKPGLQYHLAKHKEANTDYRPSPSTPSTADSGASLSSPSSAGTQASLMKQKYMSPPIDHQHQQHPIYHNQPNPGGPPLHANPGRNELLSKFHTSVTSPFVGGHLPPPGSAPGMPMPPYPMSHQQQSPYGMPPPSHHHSMPPSASMPLTVAALSGSSPATNVPYYPPQQHQMMHQQHMMMLQQQQQHQHHQYHHHQQQQQHQQQQHQQQQFQQQQPRPPAPPVNPTIDPNAGITTGVQCDFCGGDEQENRTTKLPEQMITCKVRPRKRF